MNGKLKENLPRFLLYKEFFAQLGPDFRSVTLKKSEKKICLEAMKAIDGGPHCVMREFRDDFDLTAVVREARRYCENTFVRAEFHHMRCDGEWSAPVQFMALFDSRFNLCSYTVLVDRGELKDGFEFGMTATKYNWERHEKTQSVDEVLRFMRTHGNAEIGVIDKAFDYPFLYVYTGMGKSGRGYDVEWYLTGEPWLLTVKNVKFAKVEAIIRALSSDGIKGVEKSADWEQFDFIGTFSRNGYLFNVDRALKRILLKAQKEGDGMVARTIMALGVGAGKIEKPYEVYVPFGSVKSMRADLFNMTLDSKVGELEQAKILAYLSVRMGGDSMNNLGYKFHFGFGVETDYDLAEYWHLKGAEAGDSYSMLSLGKIYSEKNGPKWNGKLAIEWFEKAVAAGETWSMGELGHCLLCGECGGRDVMRARSLLAKAVRANPDRADFKEDLKRARMECNG